MTDKRQELLSTLNPKQQKFCHLYLATSSAAKAYSEAYGVEDETLAKRSGWRLLKQNPKVGAFLRYEQAALATRYALPKAKLIEMHYKVVELYNELLDLLKIKNKTPDDKERVKEINSTISTADYRLALAEIGKLQGEYVSKSETVNTTRTIRIVTNDQTLLPPPQQDVDLFLDAAPSASTIIVVAAEQLDQASSELEGDE